jgi:predicted transcriptional regulator
MNNTEAELLAVSVEIIHKLTSHITFVVNELTEEYQKSSLIQVTRLKEVVTKLDGSFYWER